MTKFTALLLASLVSVSSFASIEEISQPEMNAYSLQAQLYNALQNYYPLEIAANPVKKIAGGFSVSDNTKASTLSCFAGSPGLLAVEQYHCEVKGRLNSVGQNLMQVMANAGKSVQEGHNYGYVVAGSNYDLTCLYSGRSLLMSCSFSKGTKKN